MSDAVRIQVRFTRRWNSYRRDDLASFPLDIARSLVHQHRVAEAVAQVVQMPPPGGQEGATAGPVRQPASVVRK